MSLRLWSLPTDIPWKRLAINDDMYATDHDALPVKWRSSVTVYSYEPVPDPGEPEDPDERTLFLKVAVSITGYQPGPILIPYMPTHRRMSALTGSVSLVFQQLDIYHPAYSALLQVAVFPTEGTWRTDQYPYFSDFEPKKREIIELVTDTGEAVTQTSNTLNVRKGSTTTDATERIQIDRGGSMGGEVSVWGIGAGFNRSEAREVGTRSTSGAEGLNVITTDASQEKRETHSHTTNMSQLYQLLDSYHPGTNRALFFVNARPHLKQSAYTFVNGPRYLEGVQDFFLVVRRPKEMTGICVKAVLETAHMHETVREYETGQTRYDQREVTETFSLHAAHENGGYAEHAPGHWSIPIPADYWLDTSRGGGPYSISWGNGQVCEGTKPAGVDWTLSGSTSSKFVCEAVPRARAYWDHVEIDADCYGATEQDGNMTYTVTVYFVSIKPVETPQKKIDRHWDVFINADEITSCPGRSARREYIAFEREVTGLVADKMLAARGTGPESLIAANAVSRVIREQVALSLGSPARYKAGEVGFLTSKLALRALSPAVGELSTPELQRPLSAVIPTALRERLGDAARMPLAELLGSDPERLAEKLEMSPAEARGILLAVLAPLAAEREASTTAVRVVRSERDNG